MGRRYACAANDCTNAVAQAVWASGVVPMHDAIVVPTMGSTWFVAAPRTL